ncbi:MAG: bifunctional ADP-dependent NAD(P)H-hydrate dehydratase/NAD(P)H-hydrate epimerase, partial [Chloroflexi bacterium]|nr:bifunctional ADP-dependent NAD(P)H-hydrate dehydratase/NAD(P)H-hydrate epimerase [Chloroflexota bacterium]
MKVVTVEQMRLLERRAVESGIEEDALMETAGLGVARSVAQLLDGIRGKRVVVLVGPGNNGGDGMVAAR